MQALNASRQRTVGQFRTAIDEVEETYAAKNAAKKKMPTRSLKDQLLLQAKGNIPVATDTMKRPLVKPKFRL